MLSTRNGNTYIARNGDNGPVKLVIDHAADEVILTMTIAEADALQHELATGDDAYGTFTVLSDALLSDDFAKED